MAVGQPPQIVSALMICSIAGEHLCFGLQDQSDRVNEIQVRRLQPTRGGGILQEASETELTKRFHRSIHLLQP